MVCASTSGWRSSRSPPAGRWRSTSTRDVAPRPGRARRGRAGGLRGIYLDVLRRGTAVRTPMPYIAAGTRPRRTRTCDWPRCTWAGLGPPSDGQAQVPGRVRVGDGGVHQRPAARGRGGPATVGGADGLTSRQGPAARQAGSGGRVTGEERICDERATGCGLPASGLGPAVRARGRARGGGRCHRRRGRPGRGAARPVGRPGRAARLRGGHVEPLQQAHPRRPALPGAARLPPGARGPARAGPAHRQAGTAPGPAPAVPAAPARARLGADLHRSRPGPLRRPGGDAPRRAAAQPPHPQRGHAGGPVVAGGPDHRRHPLPRRPGGRRRHTLEVVRTAAEHGATVLAA